MELIKYYLLVIIFYIIGYILLIEIFVTGVLGIGNYFKLFDIRKPSFDLLINIALLYVPISYLLLPADTVISLFNPELSLYNMFQYYFVNTVADHPLLSLVCVIASWYAMITLPFIGLL